VSKQIKKVAPLDPITNMAVNSKGAGEALDPKTAFVPEGSGGYGKGEPPVEAPTPAARASDMLTREATLMSRARAGGISRSSSDADLLGYTPQTKRRTASRMLLG